MAISRLTTWTSGQILTAAALNGEFNNLINNGVDLWSPAQKSVSFGGFAVVLDSAGVSNLQSPGTSGFLFTPGAKSGSPSTSGGTANFATHTYTDTGTSTSGTATSWAGVSIQAPTLAAGNISVTTTDAATFYISAGPIAGTNETLTNSWALWTDAGGVRMDCTTSKASAASAVCRALSTNITTTTGYNFIEIGQPTMSAADAMIITNSATLYIANAPTGAGAGPASITNAYALWIDAGHARFDSSGEFGGALAVGGAIDANGAMTLSGTLTMDGTNNAIIPAAAPATPTANGLYRESIIKAWASVTVSGGTPTLNADLNVTSVTDTDTGQLTVTWETDFADANYAPGGIVRGATGNDHQILSIDESNGLAVGSAIFTCATGGNVLTDPAAYFIQVAGVQ